MKEYWRKVAGSQDFFISSIGGGILLLIKKWWKWLNMVKHFITPMILCSTEVWVFCLNGRISMTRHQAKRRIWFQRLKWLEKGFPMTFSIIRLFNRNKRRKFRKSIFFNSLGMTLSSTQAAVGALRLLIRRNRSAFYRNSIRFLTKTNNRRKNSLLWEVRINKRRLKMLLIKRSWNWQRAYLEPRKSDWSIPKILLIYQKRIKLPFLVSY